MAERRGGADTGGADRDRECFDQLVRRHDHRLRGLAYKLLGGDRDLMDDVMQEAYIRAYRSLPTFRGDAEVGTWLFRIVYNACVDQLRKASRQPASMDMTSAAGSAGEPSSLEPGPERVVTARDSVTRALAALPDVQRVIVVLVDGEGIDPQSVAELLGVRPGTVRSRLFRGRAAIRRAMGDDAHVEGDQ